MEQLRSLLRSTDSTNTQPKQNLLVFHAPEIQASVRESAPQFCTVEKQSYEVLVVTERCSETESVTANPAHFSVTATNKRGEPVEMSITKETATLRVSPVIGNAELTVNVMMNGAHIKGSPIQITAFHWSTSNNANVQLDAIHKITSVGTGGWGMVGRTIDMTPRRLRIKIHHNNNKKWYQVGLYASPTIKLKSGYALDQNPYGVLDWYERRDQGKAPTSASTIVEVSREVNGCINMLVDGKVQWIRRIPECYVYVDIYHPETQAEILTE